MLRLKTCLDELRIPQQSLVAATGWSKAQVSITLSTGKLPANSEKFIADVLRFVYDTPVIRDWLKLMQLSVSDLFQRMDDAAALQSNACGEVAGLGPQWACEEYGSIGHDYQHCHNCHRRYEGYLNRRGAAIFRAA